MITQQCITLQLLGHAIYYYPCNMTREMQMSSQHMDIQLVLSEGQVEKAEYEFLMTVLFRGNGWITNAISMEI